MVRGFALQPARIFLFTQYLTGQSLPADVLFKPLDEDLGLSGNPQSQAQLINCSIQIGPTMVGLRPINIELCKPILRFA